MSRRTFQGPRFEVPEERAAAVRGLSQRLSENGSKFFWVDGRKVRLPTFTCRNWVPEKSKGAS